MAHTTHIFVIPSLAAGHGVNFYNVAAVLGTPELQVHVLVMSGGKAETWQKATGQPPNRNVHTLVIGNGKWEDWNPVEAREMAAEMQKPEYTTAITDAIQSVKDRYPKDEHTAIIIHGLMGTLIDVAKTYSLKAFVLMLNPYYMWRLGGAMKADGSSDPREPFTYKGIGGSNKDMQAEIGDAADYMVPMYHKIFLPTLAKADGLIESNTNEGLEGENYEQPHMPNNNPSGLHYMIGPILPPDFERALDDTEAMKAQLATADQSDTCIQFLNQQSPKSVVYIALGSNAQLQLSQAEGIIKLLRQYKVPWIVMHSRDSEALEAAVGDHPDGIITKWAPQLDVLSHPSTKCVLSHGGFGTMIEGVFAGQPFITSPAFSDQFLDTRVMRHLGICVGSISVNPYTSIMARTGPPSPQWPDDGGKQLAEVFDHAFGPGGEAVLQKAREASRALRRRMIHKKETKGVEVLRKLREALSTPTVH